MKLILGVLLASAVGLSVSSCKTPSKEGSSLSSLSIGNVKACKRTKDRIHDAYSKKELRALAEKGHRFLIKEIARGNRAAMIVEAALRISTFGAGGQLYAETLNKIFADGASEADLKSFEAKYNSEGGYKSAIETLRKAQSSLIREFVTQIEANPKNATVRAEAREIVRDIVDWTNEMSTRLANGEKGAAKGQPGVAAESSAVRGVAETVYESFNRANSQLRQKGHGQMAEIEVAQLQLAKANANISAGYQTANAENAVRQILNDYKLSSPEVKSALAQQAIHLLNTSENKISANTKAELNRKVTEFLSAGNLNQGEARLRRQFAEMASLEGLIEAAEISKATGRADVLKERLKRKVAEYTQRNGIRGTYNLETVEARSQALETLAESIKSQRKFEIKSEFNSHRARNRGMNESMKRGRLRK